MEKNSTHPRKKFSTLFYFGNAQMKYTVHDITQHNYNLCNLILNSTILIGSTSKNLVYCDLKI